MNKDSDILHTLVAVAMMAPIFVFYAVIAMEVFGNPYFGNPQPLERYVYVSTTELAKACSAFATDKLQNH